MKKGEIKFGDSGAEDVLASLQNEIAILKQALVNNSGKTQKDQTIEIAKALKQVDELQSGKNVFYDADEIDPEDFVKDGVLFTAYSSMYLIVDDKRNGKPVLVPNGEKIIFKTLHSRTINEGKDTRVQYICGYVCRSKKVIEWLRNHSLYGIHFFEGTNKSLSVDARKAYFAARAANVVNSYSKTQIIDAARNYDVSLGSDLSIVKQEIIHKIANRDYDEELRYYESKKH